MTTRTKTPYQGKSQADKEREARETADRIVSLFQSPNELPAALAPIFVHRKDCSPCRSWSWSNQMLVALAGFSDARGFRQWEQVERHVKKGEKSFRILSPVVRTAEKMNKETGQLEKITWIAGFTTTPVFGLEQTDGKPLEDDPASAKYREMLQNLPFREVADAWGISLETYNGAGARAAGVYRTRESLLTGEKSHSIALGVENLSTWAHELMHAADDRLGNLKRDEAISAREIVAELGGAILLTIVGRTSDADLGGCWQYVRSYCQAENKDPIVACQKLLDRTCKAIVAILETAEQVTGLAGEQTEETTAE
jgi:antirestriction protein ArdC